MSKIKVVLADDHPVILIGVKKTLESSGLYDVVGLAKTSGELVSALDLHRPDIAITDYYMPGDERYGDGMRLIGYLVRKHPGVRFLVFTMLRNHSILEGLYDCGVSGVLQKDTTLDEMNMALRVIAKGNIYKGCYSFDQDKTISSVSTRIASISAKEAEVLRLILAGERLKDIAMQLQRSAKTVSAQKASIMRKLGVRSNRELFEFCQEHRLV